MKRFNAMPARAEQSALTICSVYHSSETAALLELNHRFTARINPGEEIPWLASDGREPDVRDEVSSNRFMIVPGFSSVNVPEAVRARKDHAQFLHSYLHGESLNDLLRRVKTRFALLLDNDFFIVRPRWIRDALAHMAARDLSFFGAPFHPRRFDKYRYFPCQQCLFIDCSRVDCRTLDFKGRHSEEGTLAEKLIRKLVHTFLHPKRYRIGRSRDTSYEVYARYAKDARYRSEAAQPVFDPAHDTADDSRFAIPTFAARGLNRFVERFLPDRFCFIPKRRGYAVQTGFREAGFPDVRGLGYGSAVGFLWEEYVWHGAPFAFHLQSVAKKLRHGRVDGSELIRRVDDILGHFGSVSDRGESI